MNQANVATWALLKAKPTAAYHAMHLKKGAALFVHEQEKVVRDRVEKKLLLVLFLDAPARNSEPRTRVHLSRSVDFWELSVENVRTLVQVLEALKSGKTLNQYGELFSSQSIHLMLIVRILPALRQLLHQLQDHPSFWPTDEILRVLLDRGFDGIVSPTTSKIVVRDADFLLGDISTVPKESERKGNEKNAQQNKWWLSGGENGQFRSFLYSKPSEAAFDVFVLPQNTCVFKSHHDPNFPASNIGQFYGDRATALTYYHARGARGQFLQRACTLKKLVCFKLTSSNLSLLKARLRHSEHVGPFKLNVPTIQKVLALYAREQEGRIVEIEQGSDRGNVALQIQTNFWLPEGLEKNYDEYHNWVNTVQFYGARLFMQVVCAEGFDAVIVPANTHLRQRTQPRESHAVMHAEIFFCNPNTSLLDWPVEFESG